MRLAVVTAVRQFTGGSLTVNTGGLKDFYDANVGAILEGVMAASKDAKDPLIPFMIWQAWEPRMPAAEVRSIMIALADLTVEVRTILAYIEGDDDEEEKEDLPDP